MNTDSRSFGSAVVECVFLFAQAWVQMLLLDCPTWCLLHKFPINPFLSLCLSITSKPSYKLNILLSVCVALIYSHNWTVAEQSNKFQSSHYIQTFWTWNLIFKLFRWDYFNRQEAYMYQLLSYSTVMANTTRKPDCEMAQTHQVIQ